MDAEPYALPGIFRGDVRYEVPEFQRRYVWTQEDQWQPLWDDVRSVAEDFLRAEGFSVGQESVNPKPTAEISHFLGAVVVQKDADTLSDIRSRRVIDGQQRMITLQILLSAVKTAFELEHPELADRVDRLVKNDDSLTDGDISMANKVWPTHPDRASYLSVMSGVEETPASDDSRIRAAKEYFSDQVSEWLQSGSEEVGAREKALERALMRGVKLVVIDIEANEDAHIIYETLNARGTPLLAWDLVKNFIINRASEGRLNAGKLLDDHLRGFDEDWWDHEMGSGRNRRSRADAFLTYWLTMSTGSEVPSRGAGRLMSAFTQYADYARENDGTTIADLARGLGRDGEYFRSLEDGDRTDLDVGFLRSWRAVNTGVFTPVLMWLRAQGVSEDAEQESWEAIESFVVRRLLCGLHTRGYSDLSLTLLEKLHKAPETDPASVIRESLLSNESDRFRWPSDTEFRSELIYEPAFKNMPAYKAKMVLFRIEEELRTEMSEDAPSDVGLTIEHIMPEDWRSHWATPRGKGRDGEDPIAARERHIQTLGNLTLLTRKLNSSVSNGAWKRKVAALGAHSTLFLNKALVDSKVRSWSERDIRSRGEMLAEVAIACWPRPAHE